LAFVLGRGALKPRNRDIDDLVDVLGEADANRAARPRFSVVI
jgi:hypothetical protein